MRTIDIIFWISVGMVSWHLAWANICDEWCWDMPPHKIQYVQVLVTSAVAIISGLMILGAWLLS